jgi:hypothetical protein
MGMAAMLGGFADTIRVKQSINSCTVCWCAYRALT